MAYQGFTKDDGKVKVLVELVGQVFISLTIHVLSVLV
jgi:hypothetical protein